MTDAPPVLTEAHDGVFVISINRPQARNAVNLAVAEGIAAALEALDDDDALAAAVLTGVGGTFCAGMDLKAFAAGERPIVAGRGFAGIVERSAEKPVIAAVEGWALGGGCEVALACDMVVAAHGARFGLPEVTRGLVAAGGGLLRLPQRIALSIAMELALTGEPIDGARAREIGLVNRLVPDGTAREAATELGRRIARNAPLAVRASKRILNDSRDWPSSEAFELQERIADPVRRSVDAGEGARAFAEKRQPEWSGR